MLSISVIADWLTLISFVISLISVITSLKIWSRITLRKEEYNRERIDLQTGLCAIRDNIIEDKILGDRLRTNLRVMLYTYQAKYSKISSLKWNYYIRKAIHICKKNGQLTDSELNQLGIYIDYLVARFNIEEVYDDNARHN